MNQPLTPVDIKKIHRVVIKGSSDDLEKNYDFRKDNDKWVGSFGINGETNIDYLPPDYNEIMDLMNVILEYLNEKNNVNFENLFIKPLVAHALIAYLQPFGNGNTRLARVLQHCKICANTNEVFNTDLNKPVLYLSKNYLITRGDYRGLIKNLAINQDDDAWNKWFNYNLNMIDEQLYFHEDNLKKLKRM
jgi:Fic family protein